MNTRHTLFTAGLFFILLSSAVLAGSATTPILVQNIDGYVALDVRNELGESVYPNSTNDPTDYLNYTINGTRVGIRAGTTTKIQPEKIGRIILDYAYPTQGVMEGEVIYVDGTNDNVIRDKFTIFAQPGLELVSSVANVGETVFTNESFTLTVKLAATGEDSASNLQVDMLAFPKYYSFSTKSAPASLAKDASGEFRFSFKTTDTIPDSIISTTVYVPFRVTYKYLNRTRAQDFNQSVVLLNSKHISNDLIPTLSVRYAFPSKLAPGETASLAIHAWNNNLNGHNACNLTFSLSADTSAVDLQVSTIIPGGILEPTTTEPVDAAATFSIPIKSDAAFHNAQLTLKTQYKDCAWGIDREQTDKLDFAVGAESVDAIVPPASEPVVPAGSNASAEDTEEPRTGFFFALILGSIAAVVVFVVIYLLKLRTQHI